MRLIRTCLSAAALAVALTGGYAQADGDAAAGEKVFKKCKTCHSLEAGKNMVGPSMAGIIGRAAGTVDGYKYSDAMAGSGITWNEDTLKQFLADPKGTVAGNKMTFPGLKKEDDLENVVAYLKEAAK